MARRAVDQHVNGRERGKYLRGGGFHIALDPDIARGRDGVRAALGDVGGRRLRGLALKIEARDLRAGVSEGDRNRALMKQIAAIAKPITA